MRGVLFGDLGLMVVSAGAGKVLENFLEYESDAKSVVVGNIFELPLPNGGDAYRPATKSSTTSGNGAFAKLPAPPDKDGGKFPVIERAKSVPDHSLKRWRRASTAGLECCSTFGGWNGHGWRNIAIFRRTRAFQLEDYRATDGRRGF